MKTEAIFGGLFIGVYGSFWIVGFITLVTWAVAGIGYSDFPNSCNPEKATECNRYVPIEAMPQSFKVENKTCTACADEFRYETCKVYESVPCFDSQVDFDYHTKSSSKPNHCYYTFESSVLDYNQAWAKLTAKFANNKIYYLLTKHLERNQCHPATSAQIHAWNKGHTVYYTSKVMGWVTCILLMLAFVTSFAGILMFGGSQEHTAKTVV